MWAFRDWLPVDPPTGLARHAGGTPLVRATSLDRDAGCKVFVKLEPANPTGSFKDRGSAVGLAGTMGAVGTVSHGNMAMSIAALAADADRRCLVFVPEDISAERLGHIGQYDPTIYRVTGDYGDLYAESITLGAESDVSFVNSDSPLRVAGQKTTGLEICAAVAPETVDAIVLPVSSGGHASGVWKALHELRAGGLLDAVPELHLVQAAACDPIARAYRQELDTVRAVSGGETIAYSIANADPPSGNRALAAVRETDGSVVSVTDAAIQDARTTLAAQGGLSVEAGSAAAYAGLRELTERGRLSSQASVAVIATGTGFREPLASEVDAPVVALEELATEIMTEKWQ